MVLYKGWGKPGKIGDLRLLLKSFCAITRAVVCRGSGYTAEIPNPVFVKQLGSFCARESGTYRLNKKGGNPEDWAEDLGGREFPYSAIAASVS